jgi:hypothetical protein
MNNDPLIEAASIATESKERSEELSWYGAMDLLLSAGFNDNQAKSLLGHAKVIGRVQSTTANRYTRTAIIDEIKDNIAIIQVEIDERTQRRDALWSVIVRLG